MVLHERTHIRFGAFVVRACMGCSAVPLMGEPVPDSLPKQFRADMEDICDRVCIQNSGRMAREYGMVLLKTLKLLLSSESEAAPPAVTYVGEREFADMKRRMGEIAGFRPYRKKLCMGMAAVLAVVIGIVLLIIQSCSYAKMQEDENILVYEYAGEDRIIISNHDSSMNQMISYDDSYVYVDREAFEAFLRKKQCGRTNLYCFWRIFVNFPVSYTVGEVMFI